MYFIVLEKGLPCGKQCPLLSGLASGRQVWDHLSVPETNHPKDFLNTAAFPRVIDPLSIGNFP